MTDESKPTIAVIGAGTMGRGIVQLFAQSGHRVKFFDATRRRNGSSQHLRHRHVST